MRRHTASLTAAALTGIALLACGSSPVGSTIRGYSKAAPPVHDPSVLHGQYTAPPDRALLPVRAYANGPTPEGPTAQLRKELDAIDLSELPACTLEVQDYRPTERSGDDWAAELWATLSVDLTGLTTPTERMDRIDSCRAVVIPRTTRYAEPIDGTELERTLSLGPATLVIDEPEAHLDALLRRRAAGLQAVDAPMAPQLHPEDYRCVPTGTVTVGARSLAGVVLTLGMDCRVQSAPSMPAPEG